jgi:cell division control protein 6
MNIKEMLLADETLFRSEEVFDFSYVPENFVHRNEQLHALAHCLKPAMRNAKPLNAILYGLPATGKTTAIKTVFQQLGETTDRVIAVHVNCQLHASQFRIISEIYKKIFGFLPPETGIPLSNIYDKIFNKLGKEKKILIVALDDMNYLANADKVLYDLLRAYESYPGVKTGVFAVMQKDETHRLSDKVRSVFQPSLINFPLYNRNEIFDILKNRINIGFYPNVLSKTLLERIAGLTHERNDLRFGIGLLKQSALQAEADASRSVKEKHLDTALDSLSAGKEADGPESLVLGLLKKETTSGDLFELLKKKTDMSYTSFYRLLKKMETAGTIKIKTKLLRRGKTRMITRI